MNAKKSSKATSPEADREKPGRRLERVIELIELQAAKGTGVTVESPKFLVDSETQEEREFDVVITTIVGHHKPILIALECRDRSRPVGSSEVEAFAGKCKAAGVHQGIIVSTKGFADPARRKAAKRNIGCFELKTVEQFDWCQAPGIFNRTKMLDGIYITKIDLDGTPKGLHPLFYEGITKVGDKEMMNIGLNVLGTMNVDAIDLNQYPPDAQFTERSFDSDPNFVAIDENGHAFRVTHLGLEVHFRIQETFTPFVFSTYVDSETGEIKKESAMAEITHGGKTMMIAITGEPDGPKRVMISPVGDQKRGRRRKVSRMVRK
jgi:hypothetical protein